jgi:hypothetical protein
MARTMTPTRFRAIAVVAAAAILLGTVWWLAQWRHYDCLGGSYWYNHATGEHRWNIWVPDPPQSELPCDDEGWWYNMATGEFCRAHADATSDNDKPNRL